jgi:branched-chain amino acid transport system substrate-binding protein
MYPGVTIGCAHASYTKALIDIAGADVVEGVYGTAPTVLWGEDVPGMAKATEYVRNLHPDDEGNTDYIISWAQSLIMAEILRVALDNVGYDVLAQGDVESWRAIETQGIQKLSNYDVEGLHGPVGYTSGDNRLDKFNRIYQIMDGELANPSPWIEAPLIKYEDYDWFGQ